VQSNLNPYLAQRQCPPSNGVLPRLSSGAIGVQQRSKSSVLPGTQLKTTRSCILCSTPTMALLHAADTPNSMDYKPAPPSACRSGGDDEAELSGYYDKLSQR